jgi:hypothetical protein
MWVLNFPKIFSEIFLILRSQEETHDQKFILFFMWSTLYYCQILMMLNFLSIFSKNTRISNVTKIHSVGAELLHADIRTEGHDEPNTRFFAILWKRL